MDNYDNIKEAAQAYSVEPNERAWDRVERRLDHRAQESLMHKNKLKSKIISIWALAAVCIGVAIVIHESYQPTTISSGQIAAWEELDTSPSDFYSLDNIKNLNTAYGKLDY